MEAAATAYPDQVVVSVDARGGRVVVEGWRERTVFTPIEFARQFEDVSLAAIIYTDIDRDEDTQKAAWPILRNWPQAFEHLSLRVVLLKPSMISPP